MELDYGPGILLGGGSGAGIPPWCSKSRLSEGERGYVAPEKLPFQEDREGLGERAGQILYNLLGHDDQHLFFAKQ